MSIGHFSEKETGVFTHMRLITSIVFTPKWILSSYFPREPEHPHRKKYGHDYAYDISYPPVPNPPGIVHGQLSGRACIDVEWQKYAAQ